LIIHLMSKAKEVAQKADALEKELTDKLKGKNFFGGNTPSKEDVEKFFALLGQDNVNVFRWAKHIASFSEEEKKEWGSSTASKSQKAVVTSVAGGKATGKAAPAAAAAAPAGDFDPFADDGDDGAEKPKPKPKAKKEEAKDGGKKAKEPVVGKSSIVLDIRPGDGGDDDDAPPIDLEKLAADIKAVQKEGLTWGAHRLEPLVFGLNKLMLMLTIVDDLVTSDDIEDIINSFSEDGARVGSVTFAVWNKI